MPSPVEARIGGGRRRNNNRPRAGAGPAAGAQDPRASSPSSSGTSSVTRGPASVPQPSVVFPGLAGCARYVGVEQAFASHFQKNAGGSGQQAAASSGSGTVAMASAASTSRVKDRARMEAGRAERERANSEPGKGKTSGGAATSSSSSSSTSSALPDSSASVSEEDVKRRCTVRVEIEDRVRLSLEVRDTFFCMACYEVEVRRAKSKSSKVMAPRYCFWSENPATLSDDEKLLVSKMRVLSDAELAACLEVPCETVLEALAKEVSCVTCRKAARLRASPGSCSMAGIIAPINVDADGWIRIDEELIFARSNLARLLVGHSAQLLHTVSNAQNGTHLGGPGPSGRLGSSKRGGGGGTQVRCKEHEAAKTGGVVVNCGSQTCKDQAGGGGGGSADSSCSCNGCNAADGKKHVSPRLEKWMQTWSSLGDECQRSVLLIMNDRLKETKNAFLSRHSFCQECTAMVNQAYEQLVDPDTFSKQVTKLPACNKKTKKGGRKNAASAPPLPASTSSTKQSSAPVTAAGDACSTASEASTVKEVFDDEEEEEEEEIDDDEQQQQQREEASKKQQQNGEDSSAQAKSATPIANPDYFEDSSGNWRMATKKAASVYYDCKIWSSKVKQAIFVSQRDAGVESLLLLAEPLYAASWSSAAKQADRHAKTMDAARREMMVCVGLILCERLTRLDFGLFEAAQACCQVARATLLAVRCSVEDAVEARSDALADAEEEDRLAKAQKKKEKKLKQLEKKRQQLALQMEELEAKVEAVEVAENGLDEKDADVVPVPEPKVIVKVPEQEEIPPEPVPQTNSKSKGKKNKKDKDPADQGQQQKNGSNTNNKQSSKSKSKGKSGANLQPSSNSQENVENSRNENNASSVSSVVESSFPPSSDQSPNVSANNRGLTDEEIKAFRSSHPDIGEKRRNLRENLKAKFANLVNNRDAFVIRRREAALGNTVADTVGWIKTQQPLANGGAAKPR